MARQCSQPDEFRPIAPALRLPPLPKRLRSVNAAAALTVLVMVLLALSAGWWLGHRRTNRGDTSDGPRPALQAEAQDLLQRLEKEAATDDEKQRLLELLVALDRQDEAIDLLEPMADQAPERWWLRLLLAELRRDRGDLPGAEREVRQILNRTPHQQEALQLMALLLVEQGRSQAALQQVQDAFQATSEPEVRGEALAIGLLLADLQRTGGRLVAAEATYLKLAREFPNDQRPLLALALQRKEAGNTAGALDALAQARQRQREPNQSDDLLDQLAASWGLESLRAPASARSDRPPESKPAQSTGPRNP